MAALKLCSSKSGFSLIELVVSVAVLSLGITFLVQAFSYSLQAAQVSSDYLESVNIAKNLLGELEYKSKDASFQPVDISAVYKDKFDCKLTVRSGQNHGLYSVNFISDWSVLKKKNSLNLTTCFMKFIDLDEKKK